MSELFAKPYKLSETAAALLPDFSSDANAVIAAIDGIEQSVLKTDLMAIFDTVVPELLAYNADRRVLLILSDGEHTIDADKQSILDAAATFKQAGGVIIVAGIRASEAGYDLLERIATGGYFINSMASNAEEAIKGVNYLKSLLCAGECAIEGGVYESIPERNFHGFANFEVIHGKVNLLGPGLLDLLPDNGMYVELAEDGSKGLIRTIDPISIVAGRTYRVSFSAAGNQRGSVAGQGVHVFIREVGADDADLNIFEQTVFPDWDDDFQTYSFSFVPVASASVRLNFEQLGTDAAPAYGNLLDNVKFEESSTLVTLLDDNFNEENSTFIAPSCGGNADLPAISAPAVPVVSIVTTGTTPLAGSEIYKIGVSYVTDEGETEVSALAEYTATNAEDIFKVTIALPENERVTGIRLWRTLGADPVETDLFLLDDIPANQSIVLDSERRAAFIARYDDSLTAPTVNTTAVAANALGYGVDCGLYECISAPPGEQASDPSPLPDIESDYTPPQQYTSTKEVCVECTDGEQNTSDESLLWVVVSMTRLPWSNIVRLNNGAAVVKRFCPTIGFLGGKTLFDLALFGSNDGSTWTQLLSLSDDGVVYETSYRRCYSLDSNATAFLFYKVEVSDIQTDPGIPSLLISPDCFKGSVPTQVCKTATETSYVSQSDADSLARAAATALANAELNCNQIYTATESFTARCPFNALGQPVTKTVTRTSYISQADAEQLASAEAQAQAEAERDLDCAESNNLVRATINDNTKATPYPSVKHVSDVVGTITKITVALNGLTHPSPDDIVMLLVAPDGVTNCLLMANCGGFPGTPPGYIAAISDVNLVLDQDAAAALPDTTLISSGTYKPAQYGVHTGPGLLPEPAPQATNYGAELTVFNGLNPNGSWSLWIIDDESIFDGYLNSWDLTITTA